MKRRYKITKSSVYREYVDIHPKDSPCLPTGPVPEGCELKRTPLDEPVCGAYRVWFWPDSPGFIDVPEGLSVEKAYDYIRRYFSPVFAREKDVRYEARFGIYGDVRVSFCDKDNCREAIVCVPAKIDKDDVREYIYRRMLERKNREGWEFESEDLEFMEADEDSGFDFYMDYELIEGREKETCKRELVSFVPAAPVSRYIEVDIGAMAVDHIGMAFPQVPKYYLPAEIIHFDISFEGLVEG